MDARLFDTSVLGGVVLKNRFVRSATWDGMACDDGSCSPSLIDLVCQLAKGDVALIIASHAFVSPEGQAGRWQLAVYEDRFVGGLSQMAKAAHDGGSQIRSMPPTAICFRSSCPRVSTGGQMRSGAVWKTALGSSCGSSQASGPRVGRRSQC